MPSINKALVIHGPQVTPRIWLVERCNSLESGLGGNKYVKKRVVGFGSHSVALLSSILPEQSKDKIQDPQPATKKRRIPQIFHLADSPTITVPESLG